MPSQNQTFNEIADLYEEVRPGYPAELIRQVLEYCQLKEGAQVAEVGPGTGQFTVELLDKDLAVYAVELGANLTAFCRKKFGEESSFRIDNTTFESWNPGLCFEGIFSAQAFHWIQPERGLKKACQLLKPDAAIALLWNVDESEDTEFYRESTPINDRYLGDNPAVKVKGLKPKLREYEDALRSSSSFCSFKSCETFWRKEFTSVEWTRLRSTYSPDLMLRATERAAFHSELRRLIERLGGTIERRYRSVALLARRVS